MTAIEVRTGLTTDSGYWSGARRGLERHQTLHHAVQWSYDLLDDAEGNCYNGVRCSQVASTWMRRVPWPVG